MNDPFSWIVGRMDALTNKEKRIASYILMNRDNVRYLTETEIEENCGVSRTSITRFLRALDYSSFRSLKHDLEIATCYETIPAARKKSAGELVLDHWNMEEYLKQLFSEAGGIIKECEMLLDRRELLKIIRLMTCADHIWFYGTGIFEEWLPTMVEEFTRVSNKFEEVRTMTKLKTRIVNANERDLFFIVDYDGTDRELCAAAGGAKSRKAAVVSITRFDSAPLTDLCRASLRCCGRKEGRTDVNLPVLGSVQYLLGTLLQCYARFNPNECQKYGKLNLIPWRKSV